MGSRDKGGGGGGGFSRPPARGHVWGVGVGGAGVQSKCEGDERGFTILTNVTDTSDPKFCVCDPSLLSLLHHFQWQCVFALCVIKMLSRRGREDSKMRKRSHLPSSDKELFGI